MKKIVFDSVKLPEKLIPFTELILKRKGLVNNLESFSFRVNFYQKEPEFSIGVGGYLAKVCDIKPKAIRRMTNFLMERKVSRSRTDANLLDPKRIINELESFAEKNGFTKPHLRTIRACFIIHNKRYYFEYHAPATALVLKSINSKPIGRLNDVAINALICPGGDLNFCAPSHCTKVYKEVWECK